MLTSRPRLVTSGAFLLLAELALLTTVGCGESGLVASPSGGQTAANEPALAGGPSAPAAAAPSVVGASGTNANGESGPGGCAAFDSAFGAIQKLIFENKGCTASACHGQAAVGGLDLRAEHSYAQLVDAKANGSANARVRPGSATTSYLYEKLRAASEPGSVQIAGSPMPIGAPPLTQNELEAIRLWIYKGAPRTGSVKNDATGVELSSLLEACLPPAMQVAIEPLPVPGAAEGIQLKMPPYEMKAATEGESCVPFAYDLTQQVPAAYKDEAKNVVYVKSHWSRQDPTSHHMVVWRPFTGWVPNPNDGTWHCAGGSNPKASCNPDHGSADCAGGGVCAGKTFNGTYCTDEFGDTNAVFGNGNSGGNIFNAVLGGLQVLLSGMPEQLAGTQSPQERIEPVDGVYWEIPLKGVLWYNSHAFNVWDKPTTLHAWSNFYFAEKRERRMIGYNHVANKTPHGLAPFSEKSYCKSYTVPQNYSIATMSGHTHRHGERFWVNGPRGDQLYENFDYNDPKYTRFTPYLDFPSADPAQRTLEFCATFNNGVKKDGSFDPKLVTRASKMPPYAGCTPVACVAGKVGASCAADAECDSTPGAGDGDCDACPITSGTTTENEMFVLRLWLVAPVGDNGAAAQGVNLDALF